MFKYDAIRLARNYAEFQLALSNADDAMVLWHGHICLRCCRELELRPELLWPFARDVAAAAARMGPDRVSALMSAA